MSDLLVEFPIWEWTGQGSVSGIIFFSEFLISLIYTVIFMYVVLVFVYLT